MAAAVGSLSSRLLALALLGSLASSYEGEKQLHELLKANNQINHRYLEILKAQRAEIPSAIKLLGEGVTAISSLQEFFKTHAEANNKALGVLIANMEQSLKRSEKLVEILEEQHSEQDSEQHSEQESEPHSEQESEQHSAQHSEL